MSARWPSPAVLVVRRSGGLKPLQVSIAFGGSATPGADFTTNVAGVTSNMPPATIFVPAGSREVPILLHPVADSADGEPAETITATLQAGAGYSLGSVTTASVSLENET